MINFSVSTINFSSLQKDVVSDLESLIQLSGSLLSNPNTEPVILFIDAVNQVSNRQSVYFEELELRWIVFL